MIDLPAPSPLNGDLLAADLAAAGMATRVVLVADRVQLDLIESDRAAAQAVFDAHPAKAQAEAQRLASEQTNATTIRGRAAQALDANATFLAITSPTNAQTLAQVKALTRQNNGIIRLLLRKLDGTD